MAASLDYTAATSARRGRSARRPSGRGAPSTEPKVSIPETNSVGPEASVDKAADHPNDDARNVRDPVAHVGAEVKGGLDELNEAAEGTRPDKYGEQSNASGSGQREGECRKGNEVYQFVAAVGRRRRGLQGPEHRDRQNEGHGEGDWDVEVRAHRLKLLLATMKGNKSLWTQRMIGKRKVVAYQGVGGSDKRELSHILENLLF